MFLWAVTTVMLLTCTTCGDLYQQSEELAGRGQHRTAWELTCTEVEEQRLAGPKNCFAKAANLMQYYQSTTINRNAILNFDRSPLSDFPRASMAHVGSIPRHPDRPINMLSYILSVQWVRIQPIMLDFSC